MRQRIALLIRKKNRYGDVLPLKETAVKLARIGNDASSEYINANFVQDIPKEGMLSPQKYICTQAPLPFTFPDYWRMIWEKNIMLIVMLTNLVEKNRTKADIYWPGCIGNMNRYGNVCVKFVKERERSQSIILRYFNVWIENNSNNNNDNSDCDMNLSDDEMIVSDTYSEDNIEDNDNVRRIVQVHCTEWPDFGVPNSTDIMKELVNEVDIRKKKSKDPILVHCSAGIGRTGTFVAIHMCLQKYKTLKEYNIKDTVLHLRSQRIGMVQSLEQYLFLHNVLLELVEERDKISLVASEKSSVIFEPSSPTKKKYYKNPQRKSVNVISNNVISNK